MKGILLNTFGDIQITPRKLTDGKLTGLVIGDTLIQNASIVLELSQGELKEDPLLGPNLQRFIRGKANMQLVERQVKIHLNRAGINYEELKEKMKINLKTK